MGWLRGSTARREYLGFLWVYGLYHLGIGFIHPYLFVFLRGRGYAEARIGIATSLAHLSLLVVLPLWGLVGDISGKPHRVIQWTALGSAATAFLFFLPVHPVLLLGIVPLFYGFEYAVQPITNAAVMQEENETGGHGEFGSKRLWGSLGFVVAAPVGGYVAQNYGLGAVIPLYAVIMICTAIQAELLSKITSFKSSLPQLYRGLRRALSIPRYRWLLLFLLLWGTASSGNYVAFGWFWEDLGGSYQALGYLWTLAALMEVPLFLLTVRYLHRISYRGLLMASTAAAALRWFVYAGVPTRGWVYFVQPLHSVMIVGFLVGGVYLIDHLSDPVIRNTGQALLMGSVYGAGSALGTVLTGITYDAFGPVRYWIGMGGVSTAALLIAYFRVYADAGEQAA